MSSLSGLLSSAPSQSPLGAFLDTSDDSDMTDLPSFFAFVSAGSSLLDFGGGLLLELPMLGQFCFTVVETEQNMDN